MAESLIVPLYEARLYPISFFFRFFVLFFFNEIPATGSNNKKKRREISKFILPTHLTHLLFLVFHKNKRGKT
ncbi:Uncharacterized protein APZ42_007314 [Daphnia magna]|uniref:Uncharacterized protein n=1 Tax=Daphnia magna TaxID=35525 RepID=A0A164FD60_9CRUS|nr:Uncharacterized protein APZ42_007314 [Daphnia magna]